MLYRLSVESKTASSVDIFLPFRFKIINKVVPSQEDNVYTSNNYKSKADIKDNVILNVNSTSSLDIRDILGKFFFHMRFFYVGVYVQYTTVLKYCEN